APTTSRSSRSIRPPCTRPSWSLARRRPSPPRAERAGDAWTNADAESISGVQRLGRKVAHRGSPFGDEALLRRRRRARGGDADAVGERHRISRGAARLRAQLALRAAATVLDLTLGHGGDRGR